MHTIPKIDIIQYLIIVSGYIVTLSMSGFVFRHFVGNSDIVEPEDKTDGYDIGVIIGKCENLITVTLILANAITGLALIFTAKSIVRGEDMRRSPRYYLGGTLVNFSYSMIMGFLIKTILKIFGHSL